MAKIEPLKPGYMEKDEKEKQAKNALAKFDPEHLKINQSIGMKGVDPKDIRPPTVILMNALSKVESFTDEDGNHPKAGEFFHNGTLRILNDFECYIIWAGKGTFVDKRKPENGEQEVYRAIGIMADDFSIFGMRFKVSSLYTLSPLFTAVTANKRGMYSIKCKIGSKFISGKKGDWFIPTLSVTGFENDPAKLEILEKNALNYDRIGTRAAPKSENEEDLEPDQKPGEEKEKESVTPGTENVNPKDIPF